MGGADMPPQLNSKQHLLEVEFYFRFQSRHMYSYATFDHILSIQNFSQMKHRLVTAGTATQGGEDAACIHFVLGGISSPSPAV